MTWKIPGTQLETQREMDTGEATLRTLFLGGDITLSQVAAITGLEPHTVQNWVKRGFLPPTNGKKYSLNHLCRILNLHMLRGIFPLEQACRLFDYAKGSGTDANADEDLYFLFVTLVTRARQLARPEACDRILQEMLRDYTESAPGEKERLVQALKIMLTAHLSANLRCSAGEQFAKLML